MDDGTRVERSIKFTDARQQLSSLVNDVHRERERVVIEKNGVPVAALVPVQDLVVLKNADRVRAEAFAALTRMSDAFSDFSDEELEREVARAIAEVRAERAVSTGT